MNRNCKLCATNFKVTYRLGFTLAEVLITLAIIGVVAALTIPTLLTKAQNMQYLTALKKEYTIFNQAFKKDMADESLTKYEDQARGLSGLLLGLGRYGEDPPTLKSAREYLNITSVKQLTVSDYPVRSLNGGTLSWGIGSDPYDTYDRAIFLSDGSCFWVQQYETYCNSDACVNAVKSRGGNLFGMVDKMAIDVNGLKGPNIVGRDVFFFIIGENGFLYPLLGKDHQALTGSTGSMGDTYCKDGTNGVTCAAKVMDDDWQMNY